MKLARLREGLPNDYGSHGLAVSLDELSVGSVRKQHLSETCNGERIQDSEHHGRNQSEPYSDHKILFHKFLKQPEGM
jgi:hypothetical protein